MTISLKRRAKMTPDKKDISCLSREAGIHYKQFARLKSKCTATQRENQLFPCFNGIFLNVGIRVIYFQPGEIFRTKIYWTDKTSWSYVVPSISFQTFFVQALKIIVDSWKFTMLWDDWPIFMISGSNQQLHQELEYTLLMPDCHSWCISKM